MVIGSDMFLSLETWHAYQQILNSCTVVAVSRRNGIEPKMEEYGRYLTTQNGAEIERMCMEPFEVSSSHIRDMVRRGEIFPPMLGSASGIIL
jgi:nicotinate-nucleotide adenylyltransferase